jgi:hypothetical protein
MDTSSAWVEVKEIGTMVAKNILHELYGLVFWNADVARIRFDATSQEWSYFCGRDYPGGQSLYFFQRRLKNDAACH